MQIKIAILYIKSSPHQLPLHVVAFTVGLLTLVQLHARAQPHHWSEQAIQANKIKEVSITERPTEPGATNKKILKYWAAFDQQGRITESNCKSCAERTHLEPPTADITQRFTYEKTRLIRIDRVGFDSTVIHFSYDTGTGRRLETITDTQNNRLGLTLHYLDQQGRSTIAYNMDFSNFESEDKGISPVFLDKTVTTYEDNKITAQYYGSNELVNMGIAIPPPLFKIFQYATTPAEVEEALHHLDQSFLTLHTTKVTETEYNTIRVKNTDTGIIEKVYQLGNGGLIIKEDNAIGDHVFKTTYSYKTYP